MLVIIDLANENAKTEGKECKFICICATCGKEVHISANVILSDYSLSQRDTNKVYIYVCI